MRPKSPEHESEQATLEIRKYPNRRYYDTTTSRHLSLQDIHKLIVAGRNVRIVDAQTEKDITAKILTQILLDYEPLKLEVFSNELLTQAIRVNDTLLKEFVDLYFRQAFEAFCGSQRGFKSMLLEARNLTNTLARPASWMGLFPPWGSLPGVPGGASQQPARAEQDEEEAPDSLRKEVEQLRKEMSSLKAQIAKTRPRRRSKRPGQV